MSRRFATNFVRRPQGTHTHVWRAEEFNDYGIIFKVHICETCKTKKTYDLVMVGGKR